MNDRVSYLKWLKKAMDQLTELYAVLDDEPMMMEEVYLDAGKIAYESGERAMKLGMPQLHSKGVCSAESAETLLWSSVYKPCDCATQNELGVDRSPHLHALSRITEEPTTFAHFMDAL